MSSQRFLGVRAGPFRLALPLEAVRQILDVGGDQASAPSDPRALGVRPLSLARLLGSEPVARRPALLLFDGLSGPALLSTCVLGNVIDAAPPRPLPRTVACKWPGLIRGVLLDDGLRLVLDTRVLMGLVEAAQLEAPAVVDDATAVRDARAGRDGEGEGEGAA